MQKSGQWTGQSIGEYILGPLLGGGGFAEVYLAHRRGDSTWKVAIKILRTEGRSEEEIAEFRRRFELEARICFEHNLPYVIHVLEKKPREWEGRPCQIMAYLPGGSLADWIKRIRQGEEPQVDIETAIRVGREIAMGLRALHQKGWIHRDVKPRNILLTKERQVVIGDLGLVQTTESAMQRLRSGSLAIPLGDSAYRPPEQAAGKVSIPASDVYMWGSTLFELLTLKKYSLHKNIRLREYRPDAPGWLDDVVATALREVPEERFQGMDAVLRSLDNQRVVNAPVPQRLSLPLDTRSLQFPRGRWVHRLEDFPKQAEADWGSLVDYFLQGRVSRWLKYVVKKLEEDNRYADADMWREHVGRAQTAMGSVVEEDPLSQHTALTAFLVGTPGFKSPRIDAPPALDLGALDVGMEAEREIAMKVSNTGGGVLVFRLRCEHPALQGPEPEHLYHLGAGESVDVLLHLSLDKALLDEPPLAVTLESNVGTRQVALTYRVKRPALKVALLDFGKVDTGTTAESALRVSNTGGSVLEFRVHSLHPALEVEGGDALHTVRGGEVVEIPLRLTPDEAFLAKPPPTVTLQVESNVGTEEVTVAYRVRRPVLHIRPARRLDFGVLEVDEPQTRTLTVENRGGSVLRGKASSSHAVLDVAPMAFACAAGERAKLQVTLRPNAEALSARPQLSVSVESNGGNQRIAVLYDPDPLLRLHAREIFKQALSEKRWAQAETALEELEGSGDEEEFEQARTEYRRARQRAAVRVFEVALAAGQQERARQAVEELRTWRNEDQVAEMERRLQKASAQLQDKNESPRPSAKMWQIAGVVIILLAVVWAMGEAESSGRTPPAIGEVVPTKTATIRPTSTLVPSLPPVAVVEVPTKTATVWPTSAPTLAPTPTLVLQPITADRAVRQIASWKATDAYLLGDWIHGLVVESVAFSSDGMLLVSGASNIEWNEDSVAIWGARDGKLIKTLDGAGAALSVVFSPDGSLLAAGLADGMVRLWRPLDGDLTLTLEGYMNWAGDVAFSPDGRLLAAGSSGGTVFLWQVNDGALVRMLQGHGGSVWSVTFSPDGKLLASGSWDKDVRLWRVSDGALLRTLEGHTKGVLSVAFSPDGTLLASGAGDKTVKLWRVSDGQLLRTLEGHMSAVNSVAFSPDGALLASGSGDHTVRLWRVSDGQLLRTLEGHTGGVTSVAFSPDGTLLASGSSDGTICLWGVP